MSLIIDHAQLVQSAFQLPPLPQSAMRLVHLLAEQEPDLREIVQVIERDPALTMKVLRVANSVQSAARHEIGTIQKAVLRLGMGTVAGMVIGTCVRPLMDKRIPGYKISETEFWRHSVAAAFAAESIQAHAAKWTNTLAFTAALLHDIGKPVLGKFLDAETLAWLERAVVEGKQPAFAAEAEILSLHHGEVGGIVAQHWGLPESLVLGIVYHHDPEKSGDGICYATYLANLLAHRYESETNTLNGDPQESLLVGAALDCLGLTQNNLMDVRNDVRKGLKAMSATMD